MTAYVIAEAQLTGDPAELGEYSAKLVSTIEPHGGKYVVRGAPVEVLDGESAGFIGVLEFPSVDAIRAWYKSDAYQEILPIRLRNTKGKVLILDGV
ncbi:DUF1330 domain-containing protein [Streptomyces sp. URMC 129]|uniref:DUF1330 domain-containing protein n=1 Tax=Streptomyces sp. URMC 129 TaxID=3423407 RepID=UPI003F1D2CCE